MSNESTWLKGYLEELVMLRGIGLSNSSEVREAGQTGPTEAYHDTFVYGTGFQFEGKRIDPAEVYLAVDPSKPRIDEMTLTDYRRGVANMKTRYV